MCYSCPRPVPHFDVLYAHPVNDIIAVWKQHNALCVGVDMHDGRDTTFHQLSDGKIGREVADPKLEETWSDEVKELDIWNKCCSPDGRWIVGTKPKSGEMVCYDAEQRAFVPLDDADRRSRFIPVHYLDAHHGFLLVRFAISPLFREDPLDPRECRLLAPSKGRSLPLAAKFDPQRGEWWLHPWSQRLPRRLQPVEGQPGVVWAACPPVELTENRVGWYDTKNFRWLAWQDIPFFPLQTKDIWVDEKEQKIYAVCSGHLLAFRLEVK